MSLYVVSTCLEQNWRSGTPQTPFARGVTSDKLLNLFKCWLSHLRNGAFGRNWYAGWLYGWAAGMLGKGCSVRCFVGILFLLPETSQLPRGTLSWYRRPVDMGGAGDRCKGPKSGALTHLFMTLGKSLPFWILVSQSNENANYSQHLFSHTS